MTERGKSTEKIPLVFVVAFFLLYMLRELLSFQAFFVIVVIWRGREFGINRNTSNLNCYKSIYL